MATKYLHLISFNCKFHEQTFYTLYVTNKPTFNKKSAIHSLKQGTIWGKSSGKERQPEICELAKKYEINDAFSIKVKEINEDDLVPEIKKLNSKYLVERRNYIKYGK